MEADTQLRILTSQHWCHASFGSHELALDLAHLPTASASGLRLALRAALVESSIKRLATLVGTSASTICLYLPLHAHTVHTAGIQGHMVSIKQMHACIERTYVGRWCMCEHAINTQYGAYGM